MRMRAIAGQAIRAVDGGRMPTTAISTFVLSWFTRTPTKWVQPEMTVLISTARPPSLVPRYDHGRLTTTRLAVVPEAVVVGSGVGETVGGLAVVGAE